MYLCVYVCVAGLAYQDQGRYEEAVAQFRNFSVTVRVHPLEAGEITFSAAGQDQDQDLLLESKVRECDLLQILDQVPARHLCMYGMYV